MRKRVQKNHAAFVSPNAICCMGVRGKYYPAGFVTKGAHESIVLSHFPSAYQRFTSTHANNLKTLLRAAAHLELEHLDIVVYGPIDYLRRLWDLGHVPDGIIWVIDSDPDVVREAVERVGTMASKIYTVMPDFAAQALGLMITDHDEKGMIVIPNGLYQVHPVMPQSLALSESTVVASRR